MSCPSWSRVVRGVYTKFFWVSTLFDLVYTILHYFDDSSNQIITFV